MAKALTRRICNASSRAVSVVVGCFAADVWEAAAAAGAAEGGGGVLAYLLSIPGTQDAREMSINCDTSATQQQNPKTPTNEEEKSKEKALIKEEESGDSELEHGQNANSGLVLRCLL